MCRTFNLQFKTLIFVFNSPRTTSGAWRLQKDASLPAGCLGFVEEIISGMENGPEDVSSTFENSLKVKTISDICESVTGKGLHQSQIGSEADVNVQSFTVELWRS